MSKNRENVAWQSEDGTWNLGHFTVLPGDTFDDDYDDEWDVDYDMSTFWWVSTGHPTEKSAQGAWRGSNPGGDTVVTYNKETAVRCATFDRMAVEALRRTKQEAERRRTELARNPVRW